MSIDTIVRTISLILAPAVMITSCALLLNGLNVRYESMIVRMRAMHRERLELLQSLVNMPGRIEPQTGGFTGFSTHRIQEIEFQLPRILRRHKLIRDAVLAIDVAVLIFITSMFIIALAAIINSTFTAQIAFFTFLVGTAALLVGIFTSTREIYRSQQEVAYEIQDGLMLGNKESKEELN
jgi:Protein of unknown function (DUF2721)